MTALLITAIGIGLFCGSAVLLVVFLLYCRWALRAMEDRP